MKKKKPLILGIFFISAALLILNLSAFADVPIEKEYEIYFKSGSFIPSRGLNQRVTEKMNQASGDRIYVLVQFNDNPSTTEKKIIEELEIELLAHVPNYAWYISVPKDNIDKLKTKPFIRSINTILPSYKISKRLANNDIDEWATEDNGNIIIIAEFHEDVSLDKATRIASTNKAIVYNRIETLNALTLSMPYDSIIRLLDEESVQWIEQIAPTPFPMLDQSRDNIGVGSLQESPYNLDGNGVNVLVYDGDEVFNHTDFIGRLYVGEDIYHIGDNQQHPTMVAGIIAGNGTMEYGLRGMAPKANIISYNYTGINYNVTGDIEEEYNESIVIYDVDIACNPWSTVGSFSPNCTRTGSYTANSELFDKIVRGVLGKHISVVFSAGNHKVDCGGYNSTGPASTAKNVISVGATNSDDNSVWYRSSLGPVDDRRLKPDVVAPGCQDDGLGWEGINTTSFDLNLTTLEHYPIYETDCGTSFAAPHVAGLMALMLQQYKTTYNNSIPWPSTLKSVLIHTAVDLNNTGPDYATGYGKINATSAVDFIIDKSSIEANLSYQNETDEYSIFVPFSEDELKVTLVWDDPAAQPFASKTLVNDLDLALIAPNGSVHYPWVLDPDNPSLPATKGADNVNNVEQVVVNSPASGVWTVRVNGSIAVGNEQNYSLVGPLAFKIMKLEEVLSNKSQTIFRFLIINNRNEEITDINWTFETGNVLESANQLSTLSSGKSIFVFFEEDYSSWDGDFYTINATATSASESLIDSETMSVAIGDIIAYDLMNVYNNSKEYVFLFKILNNLEEEKSVNWTFNTGEGPISATEMISLEPDDDIFVFFHYNYTSGGSYTVNATAFNDSYSDYTDDVTINVPV